MAGPLQCQTGPRSLTSKRCAGDSCPMSPRVSKRPTPSGGDKSPRQFKTGYTRGFEDKILVTKFTRRARKDSHSPGTKHTCAICKRDSQWEFAVLYSLVHSKSIYQELTVCCVLTLYPQESHSLGRETDQQVSKVIACEALSGWMEHGCLGSTEEGCLLQSW